MIIVDWLHSWASKHSSRSLIGMAIGWTLAISVLDYWTGYQARFAPLYLPTLFLIAWFVDFRKGIWVCFGITAIWFLANYIAGQRYVNPGIRVWNFGIRFLSYLAFYAIVVAWKRERRFALEDSLTGVSNRRALMVYAAREIQRCQRHHAPFTVVYIDCDNFKKLNDQWGHRTGDTFLRYVAKTVKAHIRVTDLIARLGGDEFTILLPETNAEAAHLICEGLKNRLDEGLKAASCSTTISMGVVTFDSVPVSVDSMLHSADQLMYQVKKAGKNNVDFLIVQDSSIRRSNSNS